MIVIVETILNIIAPIIDLIFKAIGKSEAQKKKYKEVVDGFQNIEQTSLSEEQKAMETLNETNTTSPKH